MTLYYHNAHLQTAVAAYHTVQEKQEVGLSNEAQKEGGGGGNRAYITVYWWKDCPTAVTTK